MQLVLPAPLELGSLLQAWQQAWSLALLQKEQLGLPLASNPALGRSKLLAWLRPAWPQQRWNLGKHRATCALLEAQRSRMRSEQIRPYPAIWLVLLLK